MHPFLNLLEAQQDFCSSETVARGYRFAARLRNGLTVGQSSGTCHRHGRGTTGINSSYSGNSWHYGEGEGNFNLMSHWKYHSFTHQPLIELKFFISIVNLQYSVSNQLAKVEQFSAVKKWCETLLPLGLFQFLSVRDECMACETRKDLKLIEACVLHTMMAPCSL